VSSPVAVIDIGSNSIKVLVAARAADGAISTLASRTIDARISAGISQKNPRLGDEGMARGVHAIQALLADAAAFQPGQITLVATSAVREADNGPDFRARLRAATGHDLRILGGDEEANLIGRGLICDPALRGLHDFYLFDLGGGSLECLAYRERRIEQTVSLQLGCVRLTERFVADAAAPVAEDTLKNVAAHIADVLAKSCFAFSLPRGAIAVGTGGTMAAARAVLGARAGKTFAQTDARVSVSQLRELLAALSAMTLDERRQVAGLPAPRADVFPTALATLITVAEIGALPSYYHSLYNLRYGVADELLASQA